MNEREPKLCEYFYIIICTIWIPDKRYIYLLAIWSMADMQDCLICKCWSLVVFLGCRLYRSRWRFMDRNLFLFTMWRMKSLTWWNHGTHSTSLSKISSTGKFPDNIVCLISVHLYKSTGSLIIMRKKRSRP